MKMDIQFYKEAREKLFYLLKQQSYGEALKLVDQLLVDYPYSSELLVERARIIQLLDEDDPSDMPSLDSALDSLKLSLILAPDFVEPALELGYFEYAVNDAPELALNYFEMAREKAEYLLKDVLIGQINCYLDLGKIADARQVLEKAKVFFSNDSDLGVLESELEEYEEGVN